MSVTSSLLSVRGLGVRFSDPGSASRAPSPTEARAVSSVDFSLDAGERLGLIGESGCGKTTAIMAIMGLLPPNATVSGSVLLRGENILRHGEASVVPHRWRDIAVVFQGAMSALSPVHTVGYQIVEPMTLHGVESNRRARVARAHELLELVGMAATSFKRYPHELSGGMRQRVCIAMALACNPSVLLADEPTTALDVIVQDQVIGLLNELSATLGIAIVLVSHDLPLVTQFASRVAIMYAGRIVEEGPVDAIDRSPSHPYTAGLFASAPDLYGESETAAIPGAPPQPSDRPVGCPFEPRCACAVPRCRTEPPALRPVSQVHRAACHLAESQGAW